MKHVLQYAIAFTATAAVAAPQMPSFRQSDDYFRAALMNVSTAPSFVLITVKDDRDGSVKTDCTEAPFLLGAIHKEYALPYDEAGQKKAIEIALSSKDHSYTFHNPAALANVAFNNEPQRYGQACDIIRRGGQAYMTDRTGQIREGAPLFPLPNGR